MIRAHDVSECLPGPPIPAPDHENRFGTLIQFFQPAYTNIASNMNENVGSSVLVRRSTCTTGTGTCTPTSVSARVLLSFLLLLILGPNEHKLLTLASDPNVPHAHAGKRQPFAPGDPNVSLDRKALSVLSSGKPFQTTIHVPGSTSGRGLVVQEVHAPPDVVWDRILDFDHYVDMVPRTFECKNYDVEK